MTARTSFLGLLAALALSASAIGQDYVYTADGKIHAGEVLAGDEPSTNLRLPSGTVLKLPRDQVVAVERAPKLQAVFVVTEKDPGKLLDAANRFAGAADRALGSIEKMKEGTQELPAASEQYAAARIGYERALACLDRVVELYPGRQQELESRLKALQRGLSLASKFSGIDREEPVAPESPPRSEGGTPEKPGGLSEGDKAPPAKTDQH